MNNLIRFLIYKINFIFFANKFYNFFLFLINYKKNNLFKLFINKYIIFHIYNFFIYKQ